MIWPTPSPTWPSHPRPLSEVQGDCCPFVWLVTDLQQLLVSECKARAAPAAALGLQVPLCHSPRHPASRAQDIMAMFLPRPLTCPPHQWLLGQASHHSDQAGNPLTTLGQAHAGGARGVREGCCPHGRD